MSVPHPSPPPHPSVYPHLLPIPLYTSPLPHPSIYLTSSSSLYIPHLFPIPPYTSPPPHPYIPPPHRYLLGFGTVTHYLGYSALNDFFPSMTLRPNLQCENKHCRDRQQEYQVCGMGMGLPSTTLHSAVLELHAHTVHTSLLY